MKRILEEFKLGFNVLVRTGAMIYGYLGTVLIASILWSLFTTPILLWANAAFSTALNTGDWFVAISSLPIYALGAVSTASALYMVNKAFHKESVSPLDFFRGIKKFFLRSYALGFLYLLVLGIVIFDLVFFLSSKLIVFNLIGGVWVYVTLYVIFVGYYLLGFLVEQDVGLRKAIRRSALIVLDNFFFSVVVTVMFAIVAAVSYFLPPAYFLLTGGAIAFIIQNSTAAILKKYGAFELRPGEYGGYDGPIKDDWKGLPDPLKNPEFYGMTEEEVRAFQEERRRRRLGLSE